MLDRRDFLKAAGAMAVVVSIPTGWLESEQLEYTNGLLMHPGQKPEIVEIRYLNMEDGISTITYTYHWTMPNGRLEPLAPYGNLVPDHLVAAWDI